MTTTDPDTKFREASVQFADNVLADVRAVDRLNDLLTAPRYDSTIAQWAADDPEGYAEALRAADVIGFDLNDDPDALICDAESRLSEYLTETAGYGAEVTRTITVTLAGGGPSGWITFTLDADNDLREATVYYCDWFREPVGRTLSWDDAIAAYNRYRVDLLVDSLV